MEETTKATEAAQVITKEVISKGIDLLGDKQIRFSISADSLAEKLEIPTDGLIPPIQQIINAVTDCFQCSRDIVTSTLFAAVGAAIGKKIIIRDGKFENYMSFWFCHVARSGSNKTSPVKWVLQPLIDADRDSYKLYKKENDDWKQRGGTDSGDLKPTFHQHLLCDSTPEARNKVLSDNPNGVLLYRDEIKGFLDDFGRYNKSGEVAQTLSIFDATDITINRKSDEPLLLERPYLSIIGGIQPSILADAFGKEILMGNGFVPRWLFVFPEDTPPAMYRECSISTEITDSWNNLISSLLNYDFSTIGNEMLIRGVAKEIYVDYYNQLQRKIAESDDYMAAVYSKLQILVIRWAGVAQLLGSNEILREIQPLTMKYAVNCMRYFESTAQKVYDLLHNPITYNPVCKEDAICEIHKKYGIKNISQFAESIGVSQPYISKVLKKRAKVIGYDVIPTETFENEIVTEDSGITQKNNDEE